MKGRMKGRYGLAALALLAASAAWLRLSPPAAAPAPPAPSATVSVVALVRQSLPLQIEAAGSVVAGTAQMDIVMAAPGLISHFSVLPGEAVTAGQRLADIMPDPQSTASLRKVQDGVAAAGIAYDHVAALLAQHLATNADLAAANQTMQDAQADLAVLRATGGGSQRHILAPFPGLVTGIPAAIGSLLAAGAPILQLTPAGGLSIQAALPEADALRVRQGDGATVTLLNTGRELSATVALRAATLDPQTGLVDIMLLPSGAVMLGEPVAVTITVGSVAGYQVPRAAVLSDAAGDYVFLLDNHDIAHRKNVQVLGSDGASSILAPGFDSGMRLTTIGAYQLSDGMKATLQDAAP